MTHREKPGSPPHGRNPKIFDGPCDCEDCNLYHRWLPVADELNAGECDCGHDFHEPRPCAEWVPNHHVGGGLDRRCGCTRRADDAL